MASENILNFLNNGELTNFPFGSNLETITERLGQNLGWTIQISRKDRRPGLVKYDKTEFYFNSRDIQSLCGVQITYSQPADKKGLAMNYSDLKQRLSYQETKDFLNRNNILFEEITSEFDSETRIIRTQTQVTFYFSTDNQIEKFGRFLRKE